MHRNMEKENKKKHDKTKNEEENEEEILNGLPTELDVLGQTDQLLIKLNSRLGTILKYTVHIPTHSTQPVMYMNMSLNDIHGEQRLLYSANDMTCAVLKLKDYNCASGIKACQRMEVHLVTPMGITLSLLYQDTATELLTVHEATGRAVLSVRQLDAYGCCVLPRTTYEILDCSDGSKVADIHCKNIAWRRVTANYRKKVTPEVKLYVMAAIFFIEYIETL